MLPSSLFAKRHSMPTPEFKEYVSPASKRASTIVTVLALIFLLYFVDFLETNEGVSLLGLGVTIPREHVPEFLWVFLVLMFVSWLWKFVGERRYSGTIQQKLFLDYRDDLRSVTTKLKESRKALVETEEGFIKRINRDSTVGNYFDVDVTSPLGRKVSKKHEKALIADAHSAWKGYSAKVREFDDLSKGRDESLKRFHKVRTTEFILSWHDFFVYVAVPLLLGSFVIVVGIVKFSVCHCLNLAF